MKKSTSVSFPTRHIIVILSAFTIATQYTIRTSINFAIVAMVNQSSLELDPIVEFGLDAVNTSQDMYSSCSCCLTQRVNVSENELNVTTTSSTTEVSVGYPEVSQTKINTEAPLFNWSHTTQGHILGAFYYGYILSSIYGGQLADLLGGRWLVSLTLIIAAVLSFLIPLAACYSANFVFLIRAVTGLVQGVQTPALYTIFGYWIPKHERGRALASLFIGGNLGSVVIMPVTAFLCQTTGWPSVFYIVGGAGFFSFILWIIFIRNKPSDHPMIKESEILYIKSNLDNSEKKSAKNVPWKSMITSLQTWVIIIAKFSGVWGYIILTVKLPMYLKLVMHVPLKKNGFLNSLVYIAISVSMLVFGYLSDLIEKRNKLSKTFSRKIFESIAQFGPALCLILVPFADCDYVMVVALLIISMVLYGAFAGGDNIIVMDIAPDYSGSFYGITNSISSTPGFIAPFVIGLMLEHNNSIKMWNYVFYSTSLIYVICGLCFLILASSETQPWGLVSKSPQESQNKKSVYIESSISK